MSCATSLDVTRTEELLSQAAAAANKFLLTLPKRRVGPAATGDELRASLMRPLPMECRDPEKVLGELIAAACYANGANRLASATLQAAFLAWMIASTMPVRG